MINLKDAYTVQKHALPGRCGAKEFTPVSPGRNPMNCHHTAFGKQMFGLKDEIGKRKGWIAQGTTPQAPRNDPSLRAPTLQEKRNNE